MRGSGGGNGGTGRVSSVVLAIAVAATLVGVPAAAAPTPTEPDPREVARDAALDQLTAARDRLDARRDELRAQLDRAEGARAAGRAADGGVRRSEEALPAAVLDLGVAEAELKAAEVHLRLTRQAVEELTAARDQLVVELDGARDVLGERALRAFKVGQLGELSGPVAIVREAQDPGELAHHLGQLRGLTRDGARDVRQLTATLDEVTAELADARRARDAAEVARDEARDARSRSEAALETAEATAADARRGAAGAESAVVAALERELAARAQLRLAVEALVDAADEAARAEVAADRVAAARERATSIGEQDVQDEDRPDEVAGRQRAHLRQVALPAEHRRVAADWTCPVRDARFVNDWSFPRSGDRRHEGTDVFAARGTPIVALAAGTVTAIERVDRFGSLGGRSVSVTAGDHRHYYAHLDAVPGGLRVGDRIAAGDPVGTVGTTGNARGTPPHLHLGWYVRGTSVNPYASLVVACHDDDGGSPDASPDQDRTSAGEGRHGWRTPSPASIAR